MLWFDINCMDWLHSREIIYTFTRTFRVDFLGHLIMLMQSLLNFQTYLFGCVNFMDIRERERVAARVVLRLRSHDAGEEGDYTGHHQNDFC